MAASHSEPALGRNECGTDPVGRMGSLPPISPPLRVVLVEPEIPPNTGNIGRLCLAAGAELHLVHPLGFRLDDKEVLRAGMDYWREVKLVEHPSLAAFEDFLAAGGARAFFLSTKAARPFWRAEFRPGDYLVFGRETRGLPEGLLARWAGAVYGIPMVDGARSLNLATAAGIVLYEAVRQIVFAGASAAGSANPIAP